MWYVQFTIWSILLLLFKKKKIKSELNMSIYREREGKELLVFTNESP
jgi:hypothetical protein